MWTQASVWMFSASASQRVEDASDGMRRSPRGENDTGPTFGPSGMQERLNCWLKNLLRKLISHFLIVSLEKVGRASSYGPSANAFEASMNVLDGENPFFMIW